LAFYDLEAPDKVFLASRPIIESNQRTAEFHFNDLLPNKYGFLVLGIPRNYFLKALRFDNNDILGKPWEFLGTFTQGIVVEVSSKGGSISGVVTDSGKQPVSGAKVVTVPIGKPFRPDLFRTSQSDPDGKFSLSGLAPGAYSIYAWEGLDGFNYFDENFIKLYQPFGQQIEIGESETVTTNIQAIALQ